jgi:hypothetical protein
MTIPYLEVQLHLREVEALDIERLLRLLKEMGGTYTVIEHTVTPAVEALPDIPDPEPLPPHEPPWWEALTVTTPRTKIYADVAEAQVYFSSDPAHEPSFDMKELTAAGNPRVVPPSGVEVWRAPLPLSGWICVANLPGKALWVRGEKMRATP